MKLSGFQRQVPLFYSTNKTVKIDGTQDFRFGNQKKKRESSAWQQRSIARSKLEVDFESRWSNAIWLVIVERSKSRDTISFIKLKR